MRRNSLLLLSSLAIYLLMTNLLANGDPTKPPGKRYDVYSNKKKISLHLQAIVKDNDGEKKLSSWVIINNYVIKPGETRSGIRLIMIKNNRALVQFQNKKRWLKWKSTTIKTPAKMRNKQ